MNDQRTKRIKDELRIYREMARACMGGKNQFAEITFIPNLSHRDSRAASLPEKAAQERRRLAFDQVDRVAPVGPTAPRTGLVDHTGCQGLRWQRAATCRKGGARLRCGRPVPTQHGQMHSVRGGCSWSVGRPGDGRSRHRGAAYPSADAVRAAGAESTPSLLGVKVDNVNVSCNLPCENWLCQSGHSGCRNGWPWGPHLILRG